MTNIISMITDIMIILLAFITTFLSLINKFSETKKPLTKIFNGVGKMFNSDLIKKIENLEIKIDKSENEIDDLKKTNDFNHATILKSEMVKLKKEHQKKYLTENEWNRYNEQENRYVHLIKKYPGELNGHMDKLMAYMKIEYINGNITIENDEK